MTLIHWRALVKGETKEQEVSRLLGMISRQYPVYPSTFNQCRTEGCGNSARGDGFCADCLVEQLQEIVGPGLAERYRDAVATVSRITSEILDITEALYD